MKEKQNKTKIPQKQVFSLKATELCLEDRNRSERAERPKVTMRDGQELYGKALWEHTGNEGRKCRRERKNINKKT